ncbi:SLIT2 [Dirofilaria immitis]|nr:SLIT2 [Dirofilaria immitis]
MENVCAEDDSCPNGCTCHETVVRCSNKNLEKFPTDIPVETTELFLDSNDIVFIPPELNKLKHLVKLDLSYNRIVTIENEAFTNLTKLSTLMLSYNKLQCLEEKAFTHLTSLRILSLHGNDISVLPEALGSNSLYCDCRMAWFSRWIKSRFIEAGIARCELPLNFRNQLLLSANELQFKCVEKVPKNVLVKCNACVDNPCENGGACQRIRGRSFLCKCEASYYGRYCENKIDACYGEPCLNNATCKVLQDGRFKCYCVKGFEGDRCEANIDDCINNKCQNGATCIDLVSSYECKCPSTHTGRFCEEKIEFCSNKMNPCANKGICVRQALSYRCNCLSGFTGINCTINIDDCENNRCKNNAVCVDGVQSYKCECIDGYTGKFCELPPVPRVCHELGSNVFCKCFEGYTGKRCEQLRAAGYVQDDSFIALEPFIASPDGNLTFTLITTASTGVVLYYGDNAHLSVELYDGRLKISFCVGNFPASHMYSYVTVHDGHPHRIEMFIKGITISLKIDNYEPQIVVNSGSKETFVLTGKNFLYVGGVPTSVGIKASTAFHLKQLHSFKGQIIGTCTMNSSFSSGYICRCPPGYSGTHCQRREIFCVKEKFRHHYIEDSCRSAEQIKNGRCYGWCGSDNKQCCTAVKSKRRRLKMHCRNGSTTSHIVHVVRKCQCTATAVCHSM